MTHAAAATPTLRSPRRRPIGRRWGERVGAISGVVGASALVIAMCWLIRFDIEIASIAVVASVASFVDHDWLAPGEAVPAGAWFLGALWVVALARAIVRGDDIIFSEEGS